MTGNIKVLIIDDHLMFKEGLLALLEKNADYQVIGQASNGREALSMVEKDPPQIALMDVAMPDMNGITATKKLKEIAPDCKVIALSMHQDKKFIEGMFENGAHAYILKDCAFKELNHAISQAMKDQRYLSKTLSEPGMEKYFSSSDPVKFNQAALTDKQMQVLQLLAEGQSTKEIAYNLGLSIKTIDSHRHNIMSKLKLHSIAELTKYAIKEGITEL